MGRVARPIWTQEPAEVAQCGLRRSNATQTLGPREEAMQRRYGTTQVCEFRLTQREVDALVIDNASGRLQPSYDFDYANPVLLRVDGDYVIRFVQKQVNQDGEAKACQFKPFEKLS